MVQQNTPNLVEIGLVERQTCSHVTLLIRDTFLYFSNYFVFRSFGTYTSIGMNTVAAGIHQFHVRKNIYKY